MSKNKVNEIIEGLPPELNGYKNFRVAGDKKVTIDIDTGKYQTGSKTTQPLYTLDDITSMKLPRSARHIQFVPGNTPYTIIDFDTDKELSKDLRNKQVAHIETEILNQFEGLVELSSSDLGVHAYVKDDRLKNLPSDPFKISLDTDVGKIDVEVFSDDAPVVLTGSYFTDNLFQFDKCPEKLYELIEDKRTASTEEKAVKAEPGTLVDYAVEVSEMDMIGAFVAIGKIDKDDRFNNGYGDAPDCSTVDFAIASMFKVAGVEINVAAHALRDWMIDWRPKSHSPKTQKEIENKCKRTITSAYKSTKVSAPKVSSMDELVKKFSMPKAERARLKAEETDMFRGLLFKGQITSWIAMPNGGKTALGIEASKHMSANGYKVFYLYEDAGLGGYSDLADIGEEHGFSVISSNHGGEGSSATTILDAIVDVANSGEDISKHVYIFDTLKKFTDVLDKSSIKSLFNSLRKINSKGGTVLLLGHAKKYYNEHNKLVYDGMGDILADGDAMYYIYHCGTRDKGKTRYFTIENEKDRAYGTTREISFTLPPSSYDVGFLDEVMDVRKLWFANNYKEDVENAKRIITEEVEVTQGTLVNRVFTDSMDLSKKQTKKLLLSLDGIEWFIHKGAKNANIYTLDDPSIEKKVPGFVADA